LPLQTGTIESISLNIGFVNLEIGGLFVDTSRQESITEPMLKLPQDMGLSDLIPGPKMRICSVRYSLHIYGIKGFCCAWIHCRYL